MSSLASKVTDRDKDKRPKGTIDLTSDGAQVNNVVVEGELNGDWSKVFELFNLDAAQFEVVDDTVRMSTWQQSKRSDDGERDAIQLFSYSAKFRRVTHETIQPAIIAELAREIRKARKPRTTKAAAASGRTRVVVLSDAQVGKVDHRGNTDDLLARVEALYAGVCDEIRAVPCEDLVLVDAGDLIEGFQNTAAQRFTNDKSHPDQQKVARQIVRDAIEQFSARHKRTRVAAVPSNHGAWRQGKDRLGRPGDDYGLDIYRAVSEGFAMAKRTDVEFLFPDDWCESLAFEVRGAVVGVAHGHTAGSRPESVPMWWAKQTHGGMPLADASILISGHWHHLRVQPTGTIRGRDRWWFQAPTMDNGSSWFANSAGAGDSEPGLLTFTIDDEGRWDNLRLIREAS